MRLSLFQAAFQLSPTHYKAFVFFTIFAVEVSFNERSALLLIVSITFCCCFNSEFPISIWGKNLGDISYTS